MANEYCKSEDILTPEHTAMIAGSAIGPQVARARGYQTVMTKKRLELLGFKEVQQRPPGLLLPLYDVHGQQSRHLFRPDKPRTNTKGKPIKYEYPMGAQMILDVPPPCFPFLSDPSKALWVTEGVKKADSAASQGLVCVAILGVWNWRGTNTLGGVAALADWEAIALKHREVRIVFDSDADQNKHVQLGLARLGKYLRSMGADVRVIIVPQSAG